MKKTILPIKNQCLLILLCVTSSMALGQGAYINLQTGYGFKMSTMNELPGGVSSSGYTSLERTPYSYGAGFSFGGAFGYMFNSNIGLELGASYLIGATTSSEYKFANPQNDIETQREYSAKMLRIAPSIILSTDYKVLNPYVRFGLMLGVGSFEKSIYQVSNNAVYEQVEKFNGGIAIGHVSSLGAAFKLNEKAKVFVELNMVNMNYSPTKSEVILAKENGKSLLSDMPTNIKQTNYVESYSYTNNNPTPQEPRTQLKIVYPFSSIGINIGFHYAF